MQVMYVVVKFCYINLFLLFAFLPFCWQLLKNTEIATILHSIPKPDLICQEDEEESSSINM